MIEAVLVESAWHPDFIWQLVDEPPFDALLIVRPTSQEQDSSVGLDHDFGTMAIVCTSGKFHTLEMPLNPVQLRRSLIELQPEPRLGFETCRCRTASSEECDATRLMLKCWPPTSLLDNDPDRVQLAVLLLEQRISFTELIERSGQSPTQCALFVSVLDQVGLLERYSDIPSIPQPAVPRLPVKPRFGRSLTQMIFVLSRKWGRSPLL
ncbi:hypothetical protein EJP67_29990 [Variovorax guangxiensis]|uniref:DprA winged helix domain-containing protein n=1 Tax=Variovorax guangxiensis TaxID=1775474 RepID=A0A3S1A764_9BURK|nr:hypothetical protein [Variovorax guangxiensis]RUR71284.1 hypothetical protein EJP67_29990 [Variovorax guangxiensis]